MRRTASWISKRSRSRTASSKSALARSLSWASATPARMRFRKIGMLIPTVSARAFLPLSSGGLIVPAGSSRSPTKMYPAPKRKSGRDSSLRRFAQT